MAKVNFETKELSIKIVYFGTEETECNDVVRHIHSDLPREESSELLHFAKQGNPHSWYFEHRPRLGQQLNAYSTRIQTYSLPFEATSPIHRAEVLRDADVLVALVDARPEFESRNLESLVSLEQALSDSSREIADVPVLLKITQGEHAGERTGTDVAFAINPHGFTVLSHAQGQRIALRLLHSEVLDEALSLITDAITQPETARLTLAPTVDPPGTARDVLDRHLKAFTQSNEEAISSYDRPHWTANEFDTLDSRHRIDMEFHLEGHPEHQPIQVLSAEIDRGHLHLDIVLDHPNGSDPQQAHVVLKNAPDWAKSDPTDAQNLAWEPLSESLPMTIEISRTKSTGFNEVKLSFGIIGLVSGVVIGLGLGFLFWF